VPRSSKPRLLAGSGVLALTALASCAPSSFEWRIRFVNRADVMPTRVVAARVRRETCDGPIVWEGSVPQGRALEGMAVPALAEGRYALDVVAYDAECRAVAENCVLVSAPFREMVLVELNSSPGPAECAPSACNDGICDCSGGGCADAGPPDAGPPDAPRPDAVVVPDAFVVPDAYTPDDTGPPDAFEPPDAYVVPPAPPVVIAPWNGVTTGAPLSTSSLVDPPLRPEFIWEEVVGAGSYRLELFRCDMADWRACPLDAPTHVELLPGGTTRARPSTDLAVSTVRPVGARYVFRIGACATTDHRGCAYAEERYVDVGRSSSDIDGDGTADLLAAASDGTDAVLYDVDVTEPSIPRAQLTRASFGTINSIGDYDGDGVAEVMAATAPTTPAEQGGLVLFLDDLPSGGLTVGGSDRSGIMGAGLGTRIVRLGDVDGDGYADFAVTAPGLVGDEIRIYYGASVFSSSLRTTLVRPESLEAFGADLCAAGDINGDGRADLAVLTRTVGGRDAEQVQIYVQRDPAVREIVAIPSLARNVATSFTGGTWDREKLLEIECGRDANGDGRPDIIAGRFRNSAVLLSTTTSLSFAVMSPMRDGMGWFLAVGDVDGSGRATILAGRPGLPASESFRANGTALARYDVAASRLALSDYDSSTHPVSAGSDYDGDGRDDVVLIAGADLHVRLEDGSRRVVLPPPTTRTWSSVAGD